MNEVLNVLDLTLVMSSTIMFVSLTLSSSKGSLDYCDPNLGELSDLVSALDDLVVSLVVL